MRSTQQADQSTPSSSSFTDNSDGTTSSYTSVSCLHAAALHAFSLVLMPFECRFTAPAHCRYTRNFATLRSGMEALGFGMYVQPASAQGCIISTFLFPDAPTFDFPSESATAAPVAEFFL